MKLVIDFLKLVYTVVVFILVIPFAVVLGVVGIILSFFSKNVAHYAEKIFFNIILFLVFARVEVEGIDNVKKGKNYVVIANHQSAFDIIVLSARLPLQIRWVSKESVFKIPIIGQFMKAMGYISLPRENVIESASLLKDKATKVDGCPTIFPEGTRSEDGKLQRFKKGFVLLAKHTGLDVLPVVIDGTINIMKKSSLLITPFVKVRVKVLSPIKNEVVVNNVNIINEVMGLYYSNLNQ